MPWPWVFLSVLFYSHINNTLKRILWDERFNIVDKGMVTEIFPQSEKNENKEEEADLTQEKGEA